MNKIKAIALACIFVSTSVSIRGVELIVTASDDGTAKLWNLRGECLTTFLGHSASVRSAAFSPTGEVCCYCF